MTTLLLGSTSSGDCVCKPGTYLTVGVPSRCAACPEGLDCTAANTSEAARQMFGRIK